jgi:S1-C subfamily serine protease
LQPADYDRLQSVCVKVVTDRGTGSGVLVTRDVGGTLHTFVWTAAHVVASLKNADGTFGNATIYIEDRLGGYYKDKREVEARIIAYSDADKGHDLAVLELEQVDYTDANTVFAGDRLYPVGDEVVHVGCTLGEYNSVSLGIISQTDRDLLEIGIRFDQVSVAGYPGSSGGGVFTRDGECLGLLVRGAGPGLNFIVPVRRMWEFAHQHGLEWAMDSSIPMPEKRELVIDAVD